MVVGGVEGDMRGVVLFVIEHFKIPCTFTFYEHWCMISCIVSTSSTDAHSIWIRKRVEVTVDVEKLQSVQLGRERRRLRGW